ncbi:FGGY-family carbohydrate kinase [Burkholderia sp. Ac-20353]|uniref:FGGY-family carbohydrate kinase n=1 Tax=Burkholderia sp. Ac-20353 TaxID=2703894 RepID=UPI001F11E39C|nr:FGGY-family carbohydrate kinase [Burkholderia sp. Ac-20353]
MARLQKVGLEREAVRGWLGYATWPAAYDDAFAQPQSERLSFLPYLSGERSPWMNPDARGGWLGLGLGDTRGAMMRAAFEGVAFALRAGLDAIRAEGAECSEGAEGVDGRAIASLRVAGGGSVDPRWRQLLADALGTSLDALDCPNAATRGAALLAGVAIGHWREHELRTLAPAASPVAAPSGDHALAVRYARFADLYARTEAWFTTGV